MAQIYKCGGCNTLGYESTSHCPTCGFDLRNCFSTCPPYLSSQLHPKHALILVDNGGGLNARLCNVCGEIANGHHYSCPECNFDVHLLCTQLPTNVQHMLHPQHLLHLQPGSSTWCGLCRQPCNFWRYQCKACGVDVHTGCVLGRPSNVPSGPMGLRAVVSVPPLSPYGGYEMGLSSNAYGMNQHFNQVQPSGSGKSAGRRIVSFVARLVICAISTSLCGIPLGFKKKKKSHLDFLEN